MRYKNTAMKFFTALIITTLFWCSPVFSQKENNNYTFGKGFTFKNEKHTLNLAGRAQVLATSNFLMDSTLSHKASELFVRRARIKLKSSHYKGLFKTKFEFGLSPRDLSTPEGIHYTFLDRMVLDAYLLFTPFENFEILIGQHKLPGNRQRVVSSGNMELVDRSILNSKMTLDRDLGLQVNYTWQTKNKVIFRHSFALSQGEGKNIIMGNRGGMNYTFRSEILPLGNFSKKGDYVESDLAREKTAKLSFGASYDFNNDVYRTRGQKGALILENTEIRRLSTDIHTTFVDAMLKWKGLSVLSEFGYRIWQNKNQTPCGKAHSFHIQPGYTFRNYWNIAVRYAYYKETIYQFSSNIINELRLGISKYIIGHKLKIQSDLGLIRNNTSHNLMGRIQVEFHL